MIIGADIRVLGTGLHSGVQEYTEQVLAHMVALDPDIQWRLFYAGRTALERHSWMDAPNVSITDTRSSNRFLWARTRLTGRPYLDKLVGNADVFFFPHFLLGAVSPACRRVMTWHDLSYERMPEFFSLGRRLWHQFQMQPRRQANQADRIIAVSKSTADDLSALYGIPSDRISVIHSGVASDLRRSDAGDIERYRTRMLLPRRFVLAFGTQEPRKNLAGLIAAFERIIAQQRFADVELVIAGPRGWLMRPLTRLAATSSARTRITFIGPVRTDERALLLSSASLLAYPSFFEGFGFPPLEAMACETPVVAAANSALFETVADAGILVDAYAPDRLAAAIAAVLDDAALAGELRKRGKTHAATFTWAQAARQTLDAIISA